jgi:ABC-2 type transport system permease protein
MSATTTTFTSSFDTSKVSFPRLLIAEWRKLWSLRSTWWVLGITAALIIGFALIFSAAMSSAMSNPEFQAQIGGAIHPTTYVTSGYGVAVLVGAALGALTMTGEYSTGMIRATLSTAPTRLPVLWAKLTVVAVAVFAVVAVSTAIAYVVTNPILTSHDIHVDLSDGEHVRALLGVPLYVTVVALFALAVGVLLRSTPGAIVTVVGVFFLVPSIVSVIATATGQAWAETVNKWLPGAAGERIITQVGDLAPVNGPTGPGSGLAVFDAWPGFAVLVGYTVVLIAVAAVVLKRRDA